MAKLLVLYRTPSDTNAFNDYYFDTHASIARSIPGLTGYDVSDGPVGVPQGDSAYHLIATLTFDSMDALQTALASPEGQRAAADLANFADGGAELLIFNQRAI